MRSLAWTAIGLIAAATALGAPAIGCGGDEDGATSSSSTTTNPGSVCEGETRDDTWAPGLSKQSAQGLFQVRLAAADPAPPDRGENSWTIQVEDASGAAVDGATITVDPQMPDHGHGSTAVAVVTATGTPGEYQLAPVGLTMSGYWEVTITITSGAGDTDTVMFAFCVEG